MANSANVNSTPTNFAMPIGERTPPTRLNELAERYNRLVQDFDALQR